MSLSSTAGTRNPHMEMQSVLFSNLSASSYAAELSNRAKRVPSGACICAHAHALIG
jgi:hypothetical protein